MLQKICLGLVVFAFSFQLMLKPAHAQEIRDQVITDLVSVGISAAATVTGNVPLALGAGVLSKYISTYGVQGVKALVNKIKGETPQDLGEINIYYIYLIHIKRNLYQSMINIRSNVKGDEAHATIVKEIEKLENELRGNCEASCEVTQIDESLVNFEFLNIALDAKQSFNIFDYIETQQVKTTYQYLMLLYLDVIMIEQKLLEGQYNVLANQVSDLLDRLEKNAYLSNEEKEYVFELSLNMVLKWQKHRDNRRALLLTSLARPLAEMQDENARLEDDINGYRELDDQLKALRGL